MRRNVKNICLAIGLVLSCLNPVLAKPQRDEQQASRYIYCAMVSDFWFQYMTINTPGSPGINGYRESRDMFLLGAALVSDGDFLKSQRPAAIEKVKGIVEKDTQQHTTQMRDESKSCLDTFQKQLAPLIKSVQPPSEKSAEHQTPAG